MLRSFFVLLLLSIFLQDLAASTPQKFPCDVSPEIQTEIESIRKSGKKAPERILLLENLLKKYPDDLFVHRAYQDDYYYSKTDLRGFLQTYRALFEKRPDDPKFLYLYGRALILSGKDQTAIPLYARTLEIAPDFPQVHEALSRHYAFEDNAQLKHHISESIRLCPRSVTSYAYAEDVEDQEFLRQTSAKIRAILDEKLTPSLVDLFKILWGMDFKITPLEEHDETRKRIAEDLKRLREREIDNLHLWTTLKVGHKYLGDSEEASRIVQEISERYPQEAYDFVREHWFESHRRPDSEAEQKEYDQKFLQATTEWIQKWPDSLWVWMDRLDAVFAEDADLIEIKRTSEQVLRLLEEDSEGLRSTHEIYLQISSLYVKRSIELDLVPAFLEKANEAWDQYASWAFSHEDPKSEEKSRDSYNAFQWRSLEILVKLCIQKNELSEVDRFLAKMFALTTDQNAQLLRDYWRLQGDLAKVRKRDQEAAEYYSKAQDVPETTIKEINDPLPDFHLSDLLGKKWKLADLKGKVVFINVWATWCGPCKIELPLVERLHDHLKNRSDVLVLTFNRDDDVGRVQPYMKENGFSFPVLLADDYVEAVRPEIGIPQNWIVDPDGNVRLFLVGFSLDDRDDFIKRVYSSIEKYKSKQ